MGVGYGGSIGCASGAVAWIVTVVGIAVARGPVSKERAHLYIIEVVVGGGPWTVGLLDFWGWLVCGCGEQVRMGKCEQKEKRR